MKDFIAQYCHKNDDKVNHDLLQRKYDRPLHEYIVETCRNLEVIPGITLVDWRLERDQTKIRPVVDKAHAKDPRIRNNRALERLVQPNKTLYDLLYLKFHVDVAGKQADVVRKVRVLTPINGGHYLRNGKRVRVINQVVDNTTFVKGTTLQFKLKLYPVKLGTVKTKLKFVGEDAVACSSFRLDLLSKVVNPLMYFMAEFGLDYTLRMFKLESVMSVVDDIIDPDHYLYLSLSKNDDAYLEVHEKAFYSHETVASFAATLYDLLKEDKNFKFKDAYTPDYWHGRLSEVFSKKKYASKAFRVLISLKKILDPGTRKQLVLPKKHKKSIFRILRWMMVHYGELLKKDSHDLKNKRIRANETLAYFFDKHISANVYSLLNTDNPSFERHIRLLNSIGEHTLLKGAHGGAKTSPTAMLRAERYNDFDAIELLRFTLTGPTGLNGGKHAISLKYRDIYPSHIGRYDVNVCMASNPGISGFLCANAKVSSTGYFDKNGGDEPDTWDDESDKIVDKYADPDYYDKRHDYIEMQMLRDENGVFNLKRKITREDVYYQLNVKEDKSDLGMYPTSEGWRLIPKMPRDSKGVFTLTRKKPVRKTKSAFRKATPEFEGPITLKRVDNKATRLGIK